MNKSLTVKNKTELKKIDKKKSDLVQKIVASTDITHPQDILHFGSEAQTKISEFADTVLSNVKSKDTDQIGELMTELVANIDELNPDSIGDDKNFLSSLPILGQLFQKTKKYIAKYENLNGQIGKISSALDKCKISLVKDIILLDQMYEKNVGYLEQINIFIEAGEQKLKQYNEVTLPELKNKSNDSDTDMRKYVDMKNLVNQFEKKIHDLRLSRTVALQTIPQIRMIQTNDQALAEKVQSAVIHTVPLWKNQMVLAVSELRQKKSLELHKYVTNTTNDLIAKNAEMLKDNSLNIAREMEKGIVDIDVLKKAHENIISTLSEIIDIQQEGKLKRKEAEKELVEIENKFKTDIAQIQVKNNKINDLLAVNDVINHNF